MPSAAGILDVAEAPLPEAPLAPAGWSEPFVRDRHDAQGECLPPPGLAWSWTRLHRVEGLAEPTVIWTVDAGLSVDGLERSLDLLRALRVPATFFLMTEPLAQDPRGAALVRRIASEGHELGNHTVAHPRLTRLGREAIQAQLEGAERFVQDAAGATTRPFFREPYLDRDARVDAIVSGLCYRSIWSTTPTRDDQEGATAEAIATAVLRDERGADRAIPSGAILMFHASQPENARAWPAIVHTLRARGMTITSLGRALRSAASARPPAPAVDGGE